MFFPNLSSGLYSLGCPAQFSFVAYSLYICSLAVNWPRNVQSSLYILVLYFYFQTLIAPSLLLDMRRRWFVWAEASPRMQSRWHPALSVAAAANPVFDLLDVRLPLSTP
jgi:hypothetical protein